MQKYCVVAVNERDDDRCAVAAKKCHKREQTKESIEFRIYFIEIALRHSTLVWFYLFKKIGPSVSYPSVCRLWSSLSFDYTKLMASKKWKKQIPYLRLAKGTICNKHGNYCEMMNYWTKIVIKKQNEMWEHEMNELNKMAVISRLAHIFLVCHPKK